MSASPLVTRKMLSHPSTIEFWRVTGDTYNSVGVNRYPAVEHPQICCAYFSLSLRRAHVVWQARSLFAVVAGNTFNLRQQLEGTSDAVVVVIPGQ